MIKDVYIDTITVKRVPLMKTPAEGYPDKVLSVEVQYSLLDEKGDPVGASGTYKYIPPEGRDLLRDLFSSISAAIREDLLGEGAPLEQNKKKRLVPISKEDL